MSYQYNGEDTIVNEKEAHIRAKFAYFRKAESAIAAGIGLALVEYQPAPVRKREIVARCGTQSGYNSHIIKKTPPCRECRDARSFYQRGYRAKRKAA